MQHCTNCFGGQGSLRKASESAQLYMASVLEKGMEASSVDSSLSA